MTTEKLPEWPEELSRTPLMIEEFDYYRDMTNAALARMEALVEYARHINACPVGVPAPGGGEWPCDCGLDALLAACERKEAGR